MPVVAAAFCPHPPVLVAEVAGRASPELDGLRTACDSAVAALLATGPDRVVVVGRTDVGRPQPVPRCADVVAHASGAVGSLAGYGVDLRVVLGDDDGTRTATLPLSLTIGAWLLERNHCHTAVVGMELPAGLAPDAARDVGRTLDELSAEVSLLVMGDGSACLSDTAPGYTHPAARDWQDAVTLALTNAERGDLLALDPTQADAQLASGRQAWQVAAGAFEGGAVRPGPAFVEQRYGVGYVVTTWVRQ